MNILFYYPSSQRTISIESVILKFKSQGNHIFLLTHTKKGDLHAELESVGIKTYTYVRIKERPFLYYFLHFIYLIRFCKKNKIEFVFSHLQQANIISVFAQFFCKSKFYICRHHSSTDGADYNFYQTLFDKIINKLAKIIIVPSKAVYNQVCNVEKVKQNKVKLINYGYDFEKYPKPNFFTVNEIRKKYVTKLLLVKVARLVPGKRYIILFDVIKNLVINKNRDIKLIVISDGPLFDEFKLYVNTNNLTDNIFLLGNVGNVIDYLAAADIVPLLSDAEASNNVIKEAGLVKKTVIVCKNVGDFEEYIENEKSGYLISKENPAPELTQLFENFNTELPRLGDALYKNVLQKFAIENVIEDYNKLLR